MSQTPPEDNAPCLDDLDDAQRAELQAEVDQIAADAHETTGH